MGGYELAVSLDIFRRRYRNSFENPEAIISDKPLLYRFGLPTVNHVFEPWHRNMVQVQSSLFRCMIATRRLLVTFLTSSNRGLSSRGVGWHRLVLRSARAQNDPSWLLLRCHMASDHGLPFKRIMLNAVGTESLLIEGVGHEPQCYTNSLAR